MFSIRKSLAQALVLLFATSPFVASSQSHQPTNQLNLPAAALTHADAEDVGLPNMGGYNSLSTESRRDAREFLAELGMDSDTDDAQVLYEADANDYYILNLEQTDAEGGASMSTHTVLMEYENAEAAIAGQDAIVQIWQAAPSMEEAEVDPVGDSSILLNGTGTNPWDGQVVGRTGIVVQQDDVVFLIVVFDYMNGDVPDPAIVTGLAQVQIDRINAPSNVVLSESIVRLDTAGIAYEHDRYTVLDGETHCSAPQMVDAGCDARIERNNAAGIVNEYYFGQLLEGTPFGDDPKSSYRYYLTEFEPGAAETFFTEGQADMTDTTSIKLGDQAWYGSSTGGTGQDSAELWILKGNFLTRFILFSETPMTPETIDAAIEGFLELGLYSLECQQGNTMCDAPIAIPPGLDFEAIHANRMAFAPVATARR